MGLLDAYDTFVNNKCNELAQQNSTVAKLTQATGLTNLVGGVEDFISRGVVESLKDSPLRELAEDVLAQTITDNARRLSQNIMNQIPSKLTNTLTDIRSTAFNAVFTTLTFKNDMVLYFASTVAEQCIEAIKDKRYTLIALQESVRKLHNALLVLAGGGPFFNQYIEDLRQALRILDDAELQLALVSSAFETNNRFSRPNFERAKDLLEDAYQLLLPPVTGEDAEELNQGFLKGVFQGPEYGRQLAMLQTIPRLAKEMLGNYDLYAAKVIKVNALLLGFQSVVQNLQEVTGGQLADTVKSHLVDARDDLKALIADMALQINGDQLAIESPIFNPNGSTFQPNPTKTSAKAVAWSVRIKAIQIMLETVDPDSFSKLDVSNNALQLYNAALAELGELDDVTTALAILRATDGREQPGDIEGQLITFAFQANQAIVDSALTDPSQAGFDSRSVIALGRNLNARLQLSIDRDREIENILLTYVKQAEPLLDGVRQLGNSVFGLLDSLGMDRASDFLKRGAFGEFFAMNGRTATYVGAAITGLSALQQLINTEDQRNCIERTINTVRVEETSKKLATQRAVSVNYVKQQERNTQQCNTIKEQKRKTDACTVGISADDLRDNPLGTLFGAFRGIFGGDIADSLSSAGTGTGLSELGKNVPSLGGVSNFFSEGLDDLTGVFSNSSFAGIAAEDSKKEADSSESRSKSLLDQAAEILGLDSSDDETLDDKERKVAASGSDNSLVQQAIASSKIAKEKIAEADKLAANVTKAKNQFKKFGF